MSRSAATSSGVTASTWRMALTPMPASAPRRRRPGAPPRGLRLALAEDGARDLGAEEHDLLGPRGGLERVAEPIDEARHVGGEHARERLRGRDAVGIGAQRLLVEHERVGLRLRLRVLRGERGGADDVGRALARLLDELGEDELAQDEALPIAEPLGEALEAARGEEALRPHRDRRLVARERDAEGARVVGRLRLDEHRLLELVDARGRPDPAQSSLPRADARDEARARGDARPGAGR